MKIKRFSFCLYGKQFGSDRGGDAVRLNLLPLFGGNERIGFSSVNELCGGFGGGRRGKS